LKKQTFHLKKLYIILSFLLSVNFITAQDYNRSLSLQVYSFAIDVNQKQYFMSSILKKEENSEKYSFGLVLSHSWHIPIFYNNKLEIKPGFYFGDFNLMGIELELALRTNIVWRLFSMVGINTHYSFGFGEKSNLSSRGSQGKVYLIPEIFVGLELSKRISFFVGYGLVNDDDWRNSWSLDVMKSTSTLTKEKINGLVKFGFELRY